MLTSGYLQIVESTFDEKVALYMKLTKKELAEMLATRDKYEAAMNPNSPEYYKNFEQPKAMCESLDECFNERQDCVNCPFLDNKDKEINEPGYKYKTVRTENGITSSACIDTESM
jgi:hypothetical protein